MQYRIRRATRSDIGEIAALVKEIARFGHLLPRTAEDVGSTIHDWRIAEIDSRLIGCGSLRPYSKNLVEVRSLAIAQEARGIGLGSELLADLIEDAKGRNFETLFALTRAVSFFERNGFKVGRRVRFPEKIWQDCLACPLLLSCNEKTVVLGLTSSTAVRQIRARASERGVVRVQ